MSGQDNSVVSNDPVRLALTARTALEYAERAYAEGRLHDAERLIDVAYLAYDAAYENKLHGGQDDLSVPSNDRAVES